jgi:hypothetical protein
MEYNKPDGIQQARWNTTSQMEYNKPDGIQQARWNTTSQMEYKKPDGIQEARWNTTSQMENNKPDAESKTRSNLWYLFFSIGVCNDLVFAVKMTYRRERCQDECEQKTF